MVRQNILSDELSDITHEEFSKLSENLGVDLLHCELRKAHRNVKNYLEMYGVISLDSDIYRTFSEHSEIERLGDKILFLELTGYQGQRVSSEVYTILNENNPLNPEIGTFVENIVSEQTELDKGAFILNRGNDVWRLYATEDGISLKVETPEKIIVTDFVKDSNWAPYRRLESEISSKQPPSETKIYKHKIQLQTPEYANAT